MPKKTIDCMLNMFKWEAKVFVRAKVVMEFDNVNLLQ